MLARSALLVLAAGLGLTACATEEPVCRPASDAERALFGAIVAHDEGRLAGELAPSAASLAQRLRSRDPALEAQVFGQRMGDRSVRTVLMQPPLCLYDQALSSTTRITYVFPRDRFAQLQDITQPGAELGQPGYDHAACRFEQVGGVWRMSDACITTFQPVTPAS